MKVRATLRLLGFLGSVCGLSHAETAPLDGDLAIQFDAGAGLGSRPIGTMIASTRYLNSAGAYVSVTHALHECPTACTNASCGVELRPLFLPRWALGMTTRSDLLDLTIDSLFVRLGAFGSSPRDSHAGAEFAFGLGVPLLATMSGPWVGASGVFRADPSSLHTAGTVESAVIVTVGWQALVDSHLVDWSDRPPPD